jgi:hypothetical protein
MAVHADGERRAVQGRVGRCLRGQLETVAIFAGQGHAQRVMKLMTWGVTFSAAHTKSPSFSRCSSSTSTITRPARSSSRISGIGDSAMGPL